MKKRLFVTLLAMALVVAVLPSIALADTEDIGMVENELLWEENWDDGTWEENEVNLINPFPDVPDSADYATAVARLADMGIFKGDDRGNFNPNANITRAETATIICRLMGAENEAKANRRQVYDDVLTTHWASGYITQATELGVFNGDGNGKFRPEDPVTYQEMIKILVCMVGYEEEAREVGGWPNGYIAVAEDLSITEGLDFDQTAKATRSAVAQLTYNSLQ